MGKCIFTGEETEKQIKVNGTAVYVSPGCFEVIKKGLNDPDIEAQKYALYTLKSYEKVYDQDNIEIINALLGNIQKAISKKDPEARKDNETPPKKSNSKKNNEKPKQPYDHYISIYEAFLAIFTWIGIIGSIIGGIILCVFEMLEIGLVLLFVGPFVIIGNYFFQKIFVEVCRNIAANRAANEGILEVLEKQNNKEEN